MNPVSGVDNRCLAVAAPLAFFFVDRLHDPTIDVAEHVEMDAVIDRIGMHANRKSGGVQQTEVLTSHFERHNGIGNAVTDEDAETTNFRQTQ